MIAVFNVKGSCDVLMPVVIPEAADTGKCQDTLLPGFTYDPEYRELIREGLTLQQRIESLTVLSASCRMKAQKMETGNGKHALQKQVVILGDSIKRLTILADSIFSRLSSLEKGPLTNNTPYLLLYKVVDGIKVYAYNTGKPGEPVPADRPAGILSAAEVSPGMTVDADQFMILPASPYSAEHPPDSLFGIPGGVFYWIQLAVFTKPVSSDYFGGLWPVTMVRMPGMNLVKYYAGRFQKLKDARYALGLIREYGFSDAFIIGYFNGQITSLTRAEQYEMMKDR